MLTVGGQCNLKESALCRGNSTPTRKAKLLWMTSHWVWANRCTKCHENTISRFHFIAHYANGD